MTLRHYRIAAGYLLSGIIAVVVTALMLTPVPPGPPPRLPGLDKIAHAVSFFLIVIPILVVHPKAWVWLVPAAIGFGGMIEMVQPYFGRGREFWDFVANVVGIATAMLASAVVRRRISDRWKARQGKWAEGQD